MDACFGPFGDSANVAASLVYGSRQAYHGLRKSFWMHPMVLLGDEAQVEARFGLLGDSANLGAR